MQTPGYAPTGALCALHTDRAANQTCGRCGNFMCPECSANGTERMCPTCRAMGGTDAFPFSRNDFDFSRIWDFAFERWKQEWVMLAIGVLILGGLGMVGGIFSNVINQIGVQAGGKNLSVMIPFLIGGTLLGQLVNIVIQGIGTMGLFRMVVDVLQGRKADVNRMFSQVKKLPRYVIMALLIGLVVVLPTLIFMGAVAGLAFLTSGVSLDNLNARSLDHMGPAPFLIIAMGWLVLVAALLYFTLPLQFAAMELVYGDCEPWEAIKRSYIIGDGYRLQIFGYGFVGGLVTLVGLLVCCVGALPAVGLQQSLMVGLFLSLRKGTDLPAPVEP